MRAIAAAKILSVAGVAALALSACSAGGDDEGKGEDERVTIAGIMGGKSQTYDPANQAAMDKKVQEAIAACMTELGWEYIPVIQPDVSYEYSPEDEIERVKREGLGIAYYVLNPNGDPNYVDPWAEWEDPNTPYVESLTDAEREAYYADLNGEGGMIAYSAKKPAGDPDDSTVDIMPVDPSGEPVEFTPGCQGKAYDEVYGQDPINTPEYWDAMQGYYEDLQERIEADPRIGELDKEWAACMKDKGFDYENQQDYWDKAYTAFQERVTEAVGEDYYKDPMEGWTQQQIDDFWATATQEQIDALYVRPEPTGEQRTQLEAILADEIEVAVAQTECSQDYSKKMEEVYADVEERFALEHEDELKALAASLAQK